MPKRIRYGPERRRNTSPEDRPATQQLLTARVIVHYTGYPPLPLTVPVDSNGYLTVQLDASRQGYVLFPDNHKVHFSRTHSIDHPYSDWKERKLQNNPYGPGENVRVGVFYLAPEGSGPRDYEIYLPVSKAGSLAVEVSKTSAGYMRIGHKRFTFGMDKSRKLRPGENPRRRIIVPKFWLDSLTKISEPMEKKGPSLSEKAPRRTSELLGKILNSSADEEGSQNFCLPGTLVRGKVTIASSPTRNAASYPFNEYVGKDGILLLYVSARSSGSVDIGTERYFFQQHTGDSDSEVRKLLLPRRWLQYAMKSVQPQQERENKIRELPTHKPPSAPKEPNIGEWETNIGPDDYIAIHRICKGGYITQALKKGSVQPVGKPFCSSCFRRVGREARKHVLARAVPIISRRGWRGRGVIFVTDGYQEDYMDAKLVRTKDRRLFGKG